MKQSSKINILKFGQTIKNKIFAMVMKLFENSKKYQILSLHISRLVNIQMSNHVEYLFRY